MWLDALEILTLIACSLTPIATLVLGVTMLLSTKRSERIVHMILASTFSLALALSLSAGGVMALSGTSSHVMDLGPLVAFGAYHLELLCLIDPMSMMMLCLNFVLCGIVGYFSSKYLHRDEGYYRFFMMLLLLALGVEVTVMAAGFDLMFIGWELLGLSSTLLIAFFYRRQGPVDNAFWAYGIYRITDIGLLSAIIILHHSVGDVEVLGELGVGSDHAMLIGVLFIMGAMGKGGIFPLTGWLPRAMEGPTASSAIFYGALSVHVSPYLLIRLGPLLDAHLGLRITVGVLGVISMLHASMVGRVQTDAKSAMAYASAAQVGVMWIWVALGWYELAMVHMASHAVARSWQILRAPSFIQERRALERLQGARLNHDAHIEAHLPTSLERVLYRIAMQRWFVDELGWSIVRGIKRALLLINRMDEMCFKILAETPQKFPSPHLTREDEAVKNVTQRGPQ